MKTIEGKVNTMNDKNNGVSIKEVETLYFDKDALVESGIILRRLDYRGDRNYFTVNEAGQLDKIYTSVTTFTKSVMPTNNFLLDWMKNKSREEQEFILKSSSGYGTLMDILFNQLVIDKEIKYISKQVFEYTYKEGLYSVNQDQWTNQLKRDCLAFAQFLNDYEVKPILVSCPLKSDTFGIAGTLDLYCEMSDRLPTKTIKPGRINAIIDYKSKIGDFSLRSDRNNFYDGEAMQLYLYSELVSETFPNLAYPFLFNLSPKNWRTKPNYNLYDWTDTEVMKENADLFDDYHKIFKRKNRSKERQITLIDDDISLESVEDNYRTVSLTDYINNNLKEEEATA